MSIELLLMQSSMNNGGDTVIIPPIFSITASLSISNISVSQGFTNQLNVILTRGGSYVDTVTPSISGLPSGVTGNFMPVTYIGGQLSSLLTLTADASASLISGTLSTVTLSGPDVANSSTNLIVNVLTAGVYEFLRPVNSSGSYIELPRATAYGPGYVFNSSTGDFDGRAVSTFEPTWASSSIVNDAGTDAGNLENLNAMIRDMAVDHPITQHTKIVLPSTLNFAGNIHLLPNPTGFRIGLYTDKSGSLPTPSYGDGSIKSSYLNSVNFNEHGYFMPTIYPTQINTTALDCADGANGYTIRGLKFTPVGTPVLQEGAVIITAPVNFNGHDTEDSHYPYDIHFIQCVVKGPGNDNDHGWKRGWIYAGKGLAWVDGEIIEVGYSATGDCQAVWNAYGPGPSEIFNSRLGVHGASECFIAGGSSLPNDLPSAVTQDFAIVQCILEAQDVYVAKNCFELKWGQRGLVANNRTSGSLADAGHQGVIEFKLSDQFGTALNNKTDNIVAANNFIPEGKGGIAVTGRQGYIGDNITNNIWIGNNLILVTPNTDAHGWGISLDGAETYDIVCMYNTARAAQLQNYSSAAALIEDTGGGPPRMADCVLQYNVLIREEGTENIGWALGGSGNSGQAIWDALVIGSNQRFMDNLVADNGSNFNRQIQTGGNIASMGFVDFDAEQLWLNSGSLGYKAGPQGQDIGYQKAVFDVIQARLKPQP